VRRRIPAPGGVVRRAARAAIVVLAAAWFGMPAVARGATADPAAPPDNGQDVVVDRAFVPSQTRPQGEVRLVRRGGQVVVQTILYTRVLKRVLSNIAGKERRNWPAGAEGHADAERYLAALEEHRKAAAAASDRRTTMIIEFVDTGESTIVTLGGVDLEEGGETIRVVRRRTPVVLKPSATYVRRNMRFIVADAFQVSIEEADRRIARAAARQDRRGGRSPQRGRQAARRWSRGRCGSKVGRRCG
jgi:hypothetical protein